MEKEENSNNGGSKITVKSSSDEKTASSDNNKPTPVDDELLGTINLKDLPQDEKTDSENTPENEPIKITNSKPPKSKSGKGKKFLIFFLILLLLGGGAAAAWWFYFKKQNTGQNAQTSTDTTSQQQQAENAYKMQKAVQIIYAHGGEIDAPGLIYSRPATGGERKEIASVEKLGGVAAQYRTGSSYVYLDGKNSEPTQIWLSKGEEVPKKVHELSGSSSIILSVVLSKNEKTIYYSKIPNPYSTGVGGVGTSKLYKLGVDGGKEEELGTVESSAAFLYAVSKDESKLLVAKGCYACDGAPGAPEIFTIADKKLSKTFEMEANSFGAFSIKPDFSKIVYVENTVDKSKTEDGLLGYYAGPPHKIHLLDLGNKEDKVIATVGEKLGSSLDSTFTPQVGWGQTESSFEPYFTSEKKVSLYDTSSQKESVLFESTTKAVEKVYWVSTKEVIVGIKADEVGGMTIDHYDVSAKKADNIMETTDLTKILGLIVE